MVKNPVCNLCPSQMRICTILFATGTLLDGGCLGGFLLDAETSWPLKRNSFPLQPQASVSHSSVCSYESAYVGELTCVNCSVPVLLKQASFTCHRVLNDTHGTESPLVEAESHPPMFAAVSFSTAKGWKKSKNVPWQMKGQRSHTVCTSDYCLPFLFKCSICL